MKSQQRSGKLLAYILRHKPELAGGADRYGYVDVTQLLVVINRDFFSMQMNELIEIVDTDEKQRYAFNSDRTKIRAVQGHSFTVDLELLAVVPPDVLYHGTVKRNSSSIEKKGLTKQSRQYVHMTADLNTAYSVGERYHDKVVICVIRANEMYSDGYQFYKAENDVWLTDNVPSKYITQILLESRAELNCIRLTN